MGAPLQVAPHARLQPLWRQRSAHVQPRPEELQVLQPAQARQRRQLSREPLERHVSSAAGAAALAWRSNERVEQVPACVRACAQEVEVGRE